MTILSRGDKILRDCEAVGAAVSVLDAGGYVPAGRVIFKAGRPTTITGQSGYNTAIVSGDIVRMEAIGMDLLVVEMGADIWKDSVFCFRLTGLKTNFVADILRQSETRDSYTLQVSYAWEAIASGVPGYRTDLGGEQVVMGSGIGPVPLDSEEMSLPAWCGAAVGDRVQLMTWADGAGTVTASGGTLAGVGTNFDTVLYPGARVAITDVDGNMVHVHIDTVETATSATLSDADADIAGTWKHPAYTSEKYRIDTLKDNKFSGVLSCSVGEDAR